MSANPDLERPRAPLLVLALGNRLLRDDGAGIELLSLLRPELEREPDVELVDGGTMGTALLPWIEDRPAVLLLDAVSLGGRPGELVVSLDPERLSGPRGPSAHEGNAGALLAVARLLGRSPARVALLGVEVQEVSTGLGLSEPVRGGLLLARELALRLARELLAELRQEEALSCTS